jgi:hypothetical protein
MEVFLTRILRLRREKTDPFKSFISQPLCNVNFLGPEGCEMKDLNGPNKASPPQAAGYLGPYCFE